MHAVSCRHPVVAVSCRQLRRRAGPVLLAWGWLWPALLGAQVAIPTSALLNTTELKRMSVEELLQQEVVSVSRQPEKLGQAAGNVFYLQGEAVRMTNATSLPELLRLAPSLFVAQSSSYHWGINARGFMRTNAHSNKLLVLIDGRTAYLPLFSNVFWDSTDVFLPDLQSIEVISGPSGSNWGSNAVNGVINIRSRSARDTIGGLVQITGGTNGSQVSVRNGFHLGASGAMRVYAKHTEREASLSATGAEDDRDRWQSNQAGFRADWQVANGDELMFQGDWLSGRYDALPQSPIRNDAGHLMVRWQREMPGSRLWVRGYYDYSRRDTSGLLTEVTRTADVEFQHSADRGTNQRILWGANYRRIYDAADDTVGYAILPAHLWMSLGAVFGQHEVRWANDAWRLTSGLRFEHNDFTGWETQPTLRLARQGEKFTAWASAARATRTPSRLDKGFFAPATPPYVVVGGPDFVSEVLNAYEIGWRGQVADGASLTLTAYYHDYDDLRSVEPTTPIVEANGVEGKSYGLEWFLDYDITPRWRLRAGGFVMRQETWLKPGGADIEGGRGEASFPEYQVYFRNSFRLTPKVDLWLSLRRIGEVPANENGFGVVPAYTELNARLGWQVRPDLELSLVGRNLLDKSHPEIGGATARREIRRSIAAAVRWEY